MGKKDLLDVVDKFIEEKNASWNHEEWLSLVNAVKDKGFEIEENELGCLLEDEREVYHAKKSGNYVLPKHKLVELCRNFVKRTNAEYTKDQVSTFMNDAGLIGVFNRDELKLILAEEKESYLVKRKKTTIDLEELEDLRKAIAELQRKLSRKDSHIAEQRDMMEKLQAELIKKENALKTHLEESKNRENLLEVVRKDLQHEREFIDKNSKSIIEKEQALNAKEGELKAKGYEVSEKLAELSKKLEYYKLLEKKSGIDSDKLMKTTSDFNHQVNINKLLAKKVSLLEKQLHSKIVEYEKLRVVNKEMDESYAREKNLLEDAEKKIRQLGKEAMEKKVEAEKRHKWVLEHEKPLKELQENLEKMKKELGEREITVSKKEKNANDRQYELKRREKELLQKETKLILSYKKLEKNKSELAISKKEADAKYGESGKSIRSQQKKIDMALEELEEHTKALSKQRQKNKEEKEELIAKEKHLKSVYIELRKMKNRLDKREIDIIEKEKKLHTAMDKNNKLIEEGNASLEKYKDSLERTKIELQHKEKELDEKSRKLHEEAVHIENEKLRLEKKFLSMITNRE